MKIKIILLLLILSFAPSAIAAKKVVGADDRIKTLVFDTNEVYRIVTRSGFQTTLEFAPDEVIDTLSIGDSIGWQITPASRRLFIKPLHKSGITNLNVITNKRTYQFELVATSSNSMSSSHAYVVKFYYPELAYKEIEPLPGDRSRGFLRPVSETPIPQLPEPVAPLPAPVVTSALPTTIPSLPVLPSVPEPAFMPAAMAMNYSYTISGPDGIAPLKIFDDGRSTYFQFDRNVMVPPQFFVIEGNHEKPIQSRVQGILPNGEVVVDAVASKIAIKQGKEKVFVYNESKTLGY